MKKEGLSDCRQRPAFQCDRSTQLVSTRSSPRSPKQS